MNTDIIFYNFDILFMICIDNIYIYLSFLQIQQNQQESKLIKAVILAEYLDKMIIQRTFLPNLITKSKVLTVQKQNNLQKYQSTIKRLQSNEYGKYIHYSTDKRLNKTQLSKLKTQNTQTSVKLFEQEIEKQISKNRKLRINLEQTAPFFYKVHNSCHILQSDNKNKKRSANQPRQTQKNNLQKNIKTSPSIIQNIKTCPLKDRQQQIIKNAYQNKYSFKQFNSKQIFNEIALLNQQQRFLTNQSNKNDNLKLSKKQSRTNRKKGLPLLQQNQILQNTINFNKNINKHIKTQDNFIFSNDLIVLSKQKQQMNHLFQQKLKLKDKVQIKDDQLIVKNFTQNLIQDKVQQTIDKPYNLRQSVVQKIKLLKLIKSEKKRILKSSVKTDSSLHKRNTQSPISQYSIELSQQKKQKYLQKLNKIINQPKQSIDLSDTSQNISFSKKSQLNPQSIQISKLEIKHLQNVDKLLKNQTPKRKLKKEINDTPWNISIKVQKRNQLQ